MALKTGRTGKMVAYYCPRCFYKPKGRVVSTACHCGCELRGASNVKSRAQVVTRLKNKLGNKRSKRSEYQLYLASPAWCLLRERVLCRDVRLCRCCGRDAQVVHHRDYSNKTMSGDSLDGLISLCKNCHKTIHRDERGKLLGVRATEAKLIGKLELPS
jgi:5-methylcytosine-specific restriction endonuclease McrA